MAFCSCNVPVFAEQTDYTALMATLVINGFFRGATFINFTLTIAEYCSLDKLPAAFGLHMVAKGLFIVALSPPIGKDKAYMLLKHVFCDSEHQRLLQCGFICNCQKLLFLTAC
jgi:hypothetical protein